MASTGNKRLDVVFSKIESERQHKLLRNFPTIQRELSLLVYVDSNGAIFCRGSTCLA